jgi:hypothetical protein
MPIRVKDRQARNSINFSNLLEVEVLLENLIPKSWVGSANVRLPLAFNVVALIVIWVICLALIYTIARYRKMQGTSARWTTQDILIIAIMGVLLVVYDNLIGDQFITPIVQAIPFAHAFALNDLPYMFLLMVGIAMTRKPGAATAMIFLNFLLMQLLYGGAESGILWWPYGLTQGLFIDLYFIMRGGRVFARSGVSAFWDGLAMGALRAIPAAFIQQIFLGPFLSGWTVTAGFIIWYALFNMIGNALEAAITAPFAIRVARSVNQSAGQDYTMQESAVGGDFK